MNSIESLRQAVLKLRELSDLVDQRHEAAYDHGQRLNEYVILKGRFYLDTCGNFSKITELAGDTSKLEDVMTKDDFLKALGPTSSMTSTPASLPYEFAKCRVCEKGWTIENCHDYRHLEHGDFHDRCIYLEQATNELEDFRSVFRAAGFKHALFTAIPNGYWPGERYYAAPWYNVETPYGNIRIGWRKRVINIDWSQTGKKLDEFFSDDVTKWDHGIHAWGYPKAVEYLRTLRELLYTNSEALEKRRARKGVTQ